MIKYKIQTGRSYTNTIARNRRDYAYKPYLKGMHCRTCNKDTIIEFVEDELIVVRAVINSCCSNFHTRIKEKLAASG